jgi:hypothetical protein
MPASSLSKAPVIACLDELRCRRRRDNGIRGGGGFLEQRSVMPAVTQRTATAHSELGEQREN